MALKDTMNTLRDYLTQFSRDLEKANRGNKAAAQRFRTNSVKFAKIAKVYRKESIAAENVNKKSKKVTKSTIKKSKGRVK